MKLQLVAGWLHEAFLFIEFQWKHSVWYEIHFVSLRSVAWSEHCVVFFFFIKFSFCWEKYRSRSEIKLWNSINLFYSFVCRYKWNRWKEVTVYGLLLIQLVIRFPLEIFGPSRSEYRLCKLGKCEEIRGTTDTQSNCNIYIPIIRNW